MTGLIAILTIILLAVIIVQLGRISEIAGKIRGEEHVQEQLNNRTGFYFLLFMVGFLIFCFVSAWMYKDDMLGYGPHQAASEHGGSLDAMFNITLIFTGIVFVLTHVALFWFSYKYKAEKGRVSKFFAHSSTLEMVWTAVPTVVLVFLVVRGLNVWNTVMPDVDPEEDYIEIEATGYQFAWDLRYPGPDGKLGTRNYKLINPGNNPLGQDWTDVKNHDDFLPTEIVLPVDQKVRVRITAKDVLHNFYLPHFRVKMDAVPGLPTYFIFTPIKTTDDYRQELRNYPEWQVPADPTEPDGPQKWETFNYELACAELCGKGHYSMRRVVRIVEQEEYEEWLSQQSSYYMSNVRNSQNDPLAGKLIGLEVVERKQALESQLSSAITKDESDAIKLENVFFEAASASLADDSKYELDHLAELLNANANVTVEISGHTDDTGDYASNLEMSQNRADAVRDYLISGGVDASRLTAVGYGDRNPVDSNETEEGRQNNRRTDLKILSK